MNKGIFTLIFASVMMFGIPAESRAHAAIEIVDNDFQNVTISVSESVLHVTGANGLTLQVFNVTGVRVMSIKVEGADHRFMDQKKLDFIIQKIIELFAPKEA